MKIVNPQRDADENMKITAEADPADRAVIATGLSAYNLAKAGTPDIRPLNVLLRDDKGNTVGGLWGRTYWRWLYVELLFVPDALRGRNMGARLLGAAESEARIRDCVGVWLDTFAFQSPGFYERLGYARFGKLADYPPGFDRLFFAKPL